MRSTKQRFRYDVFVSYSHYNQAWVCGWFVPQLQTVGLTVCLDRESFTPGAPLVTEMERAVLQSRKTILVLTPEYFSSAWTEFENMLLQTLDPAARQRRLIPLLLIPCELPLRLRMLTPIDYTNLTEHAEKISTVVAAIRSRRTSISRRQAVTSEAMPLPFEVPTGALPLDSSVYIERSYDGMLRQQITRVGSTTVVEGARQMGKSSLLARALAHARLQQYVTIDFDFQELTEDNLESLESVLRYLAEAFYVRLDLPATPQEIWQLSLGTKEKLTYFVERHILQGTPMQVVLVIDEVDRVFGRPYQDDFFGLLRAWHNRRARYPLWKKLNLVLSHSTDPRQAIKDRRQSPFNVGYPLRLQDFSLDEVVELNQRYQRPVRRKDHLLGLVDMLGGHPYLIQQALYALASKAYMLSYLLDTNKMDEGPFAAHLGHYRHLLTSEAALGQNMQHVLRHGSCPTYEVLVRLRALGLVVGTSQDNVKPRCKLYADYFVRVLP